MPVELVALLGIAVFLLESYAFAIWLVLFTPFLRWCFYAGVAYLVFQVALLPIKLWTFQRSGGTERRMLPEEILSKTEVAIQSEIGSGERLEHYVLNARGSISNHSDRVIERIFVWCRVEKLALGDSEVTGRWFDVSVRPGETKQFVAPISDSVTGVIRAGLRGLQPPEMYFCRVDDVNATLPPENHHRWPSAS